MTELPRPGALLGDGLLPDRFRIRQRLGQGASGQVFLAWDSFFEREVALKVLDLDLGDPGSDGGALSPGLAATLHEARALARLRHPNVVSVHELVHRVSPPLLLMEYVEGEELEQILQRAEQPLDPSRAVQVGRALAAALAAAHQAGMIHGDVKPANLLIADDGSLKLIDFGLARRPAQAAAAGGLLGSPAYTAPEVLEGAEPDARADLFGVGVILYRMLTLQYPFPASSLEELRGRLRGPAPDPRSLQPGVSVWLAEVVQRCLAPAEQRYASAEQLLGGLERAAAAGGRSLPAAPYPGLRPFGSDEAGVFFGRQEELARLLARLRLTPVLLLAGASGSGKSSLAAAGVAPALASGGIGEGRSCRVVVVAPGRRPLQALAAALAAPGRGPELEAELTQAPGRAWRRLLGPPRRGAAVEGLLVIIDPLEELCTICSDPEEQARFGQALLGAAEANLSELRLLLCARDDFLGRLARVPGLGECLGALHLVRPLDGESLRAAVLEPARAFGFSFEDEALLEAMLGELAGRPGTMPLLQYALHLLWAQRDEPRRLLSAAALRALGGLGAALASAAERAHQDLVAAGLGEETRRLLLELCTADGTRRARSLAELLGPARQQEPARRVLERLRQERLLVGPESALELAHESLTREWHRLRRWLEEARSLRQLAEEAEHDAQRWLARQRPPESLWRGRALEESRRLRQDLLSTASHDFLQASREQARRARRRRLALGLGLALLASLAIGFSGWGLLREWQAARRQASAERAALRAERQLRLAEQQRSRAEHERALALDEKRKLLEAWLRERQQLQEDLRRAADQGLRAHIAGRLAQGPPALASAPPPQPTALRPELCLFAPAADLSLAGPWRDRLREIGERLRRAGYPIGCRYPYLREAARFRAAARHGEIQHGGAVPEAALQQLLLALRPLYPQIGLRRVRPGQLFRSLDVLIPD